MSATTSLILASASPRRAELLEQIGVQFTVCSADIDESVLPNESPLEYVGRLAKEKAQAVWPKFKDKAVLAADTTVVLDNEILGKPESPEHAVEMLKSLSGKVHHVYTGVAICKLVNGEVNILSEVVKTQVTFLPLSIEQVTNYVTTKEPMDKAGAYGIQGKGAVFIESIEGSYSNVVGLPLAQTARLLTQCEVPIWLA